MTIRMSGMVSGMDTESPLWYLLMYQRKISESPDQVVLQAGCMEGFEYQSI